MSRMTHVVDLLCLDVPEGLELEPLSDIDGDFLDLGLYHSERSLERVVFELREL